MNHIQCLAAATAIKVMLDKGHVSICTIDDILKMSGVIPDKKAYDTLRILHCVNFRDMPRELQEQIPTLIKTVLSGPTISVVDCVPTHNCNESRRISFAH